MVGNPANSVGAGHVGWNVCGQVFNLHWLSLVIFIGSREVRQILVDNTVTTGEGDVQQTLMGHYLLLYI